MPRPLETPATPPAYASHPLLRSSHFPAIVAFSFLSSIGLFFAFIPSYSFPSALPPFSLSYRLTFVSPFMQSLDLSHRLSGSGSFIILSTVSCLRPPPPPPPLPAFFLLLVDRFGGEVQSTGTVISDAICVVVYLYSASFAFVLLRVGRWRAFFTAR